MLPDRAAILTYLTILSGSAGRLVISLVYFLIVANTLTLAEFGLFATASATGLILSRLLAFGFVSPLYRVATVKPRLLGTFYAGYAALALASLPVVLAAAALCYGGLFAGRLALLPFALIVLAEVLGWRLVEVVAIVCNGLRQFRRAAALVILGSSLRTLAALAFWLSSAPTLLGWTVAYVLATAASAALALWFFLPRRRWRLAPALYRRRMTDALYAGAADIAFYVQAELDKLLVLALAGERIAGLYAIAIRVVDLTAMPVRSFNQMLVQRIMRERGLSGGARRLALTEAGIAAVSVAGLAAVAGLLALAPNALGRNVAEASWLLWPLLLVPAFRNLVEYHAELLYARERTGARMGLLVAVAALKAALMVWALRGAGADGGWAASLNLVFGAAWLVSAALTYRLLRSDPSPAAPRRARAGGEAAAP